MSLDLDLGVQREASSEGAVEVAENLGPARVLLVRWAGERIHVLARRDLAVRRGDRIRPRVDPARVVVWPAG